MGIYGRNGYLQDRWNWLDAIVVLSGWASLALDTGLNGGTSCLEGNDSSVSSIRVIRMLRPLRAINGIPGLRRIIAALIGAVPQLMNVMLMCSFIFLIFGLLGLQLFRGRLQQRCYRDIPSLLWVKSNSSAAAVAVAAPGAWPAAGTTRLSANITRQWEWEEGAEGHTGPLCSMISGLGRRCDPGWTCGNRCARARPSPNCSAGRGVVRCLLMLLKRLTCRCVLCLVLDPPPPPPPPFSCRCSSTAVSHRMAT